MKLYIRLTTNNEKGDKDMTIGELKDILNGYDDNDKVLFKPANSSYYVEAISHATGKNVNPFWGNKDYNAVVLISDGQVGSV